ncbi:PD-(D/E)XK nuclease family protein [Collimonas sp. H4R21]|uniref:PD-(D/E)XK nuclease family protein n=1 Tax=Collimonas rhizosphaerae TaxID=3126357 RepID=A0ABU9PT90_9BURK
MSINITDKFHEFLADSNLALALESVKRVDDVFDIINPNETQHSCILQWLFDPREGHGQGEEIFKDFLNAVYNVDSESDFHQDLFKAWTPSRIAVSGFQSLIVVREKSILKKGRQDLLLVDPVHKFIILVENKSGSRWTAVQLKSYRTQLEALAKPRKPYHGYKIGLVLLDRLKDEETLDDGEVKRWAYIDYTWLEKAARRAEVRASRNGDLGHQLVISYCRRQAGYESTEERKLDEILVSLNQAHRDVVHEIGLARRTKRPGSTHLALDGIESLIWVWTHQNRDLSAMLENQKPLAFLKGALEKTFGSSLDFDVRKKTMLVIDKSWESFCDPNSVPSWPFLIKVRDTSLSDDGALPEKRKYSVVVEFWHGFVKNNLVGEIRMVLNKLYGKEALRFSGANVRRLGRQKDITEDKLHGEVKKMLTTLQRELEAITS